MTRLRRIYKLLKNRLIIIGRLVVWFLGIKINQPRRILGVWDIKHSGFSLGSFMEFQTMLLCLARQQQVKKIDIAFVCETSQYLINPKSPWLNSENLSFHFQELWPLVHINPQLGSVFFFDTIKDFEDFFKDRHDLYLSHPSPYYYFSGSGSHLGIFNSFREFYQKNGFLPELELSKIANAWALAFLKDNFPGQYVVTVSLRANDHLRPQRNSNFIAWNEFFSHCLKHPQVVFLVLSRRGELEGKIKPLPNLFFSKDCGTTIEQDLALLKNSLFYMATCAGPASLPFLSSTIPYIITRFRPPEKNLEESWLPFGSALPWQNPPIQKLLWDDESSQLLIKEFELLLTNLDKKEWQKKINQASPQVLEWPYLIK